MSSQQRVTADAPQRQATESHERRADAPMSPSEVMGAKERERQRALSFVSLSTALIRNAIDHGLEDTTEREARGKAPNGKLFIGVRQTESWLDVIIGDDERGIDWDALGKRATSLGVEVPGSDPKEAFFVDGLSSRESVTALSGRGIGMGAVRAAIHRLGGTMLIDSELGHGTTFTCRFPLASACRALPLKDAAIACDRNEVRG